MSDRIKDIEGTVASEAEAATALGFVSADEYRRWRNEDSPRGRCSNDDCWRPAFWPNLDKPCKYCGSSIRVIYCDHGGREQANPLARRHEGGDDDESIRPSQAASEAR